MLYHFCCFKGSESWIYERTFNDAKSVVSELSNNEDAEYILVFDEKCKLVMEK